MANIELIKERMEKANAVIAKKENTIVKKTNMIAKKQAKYDKDIQKAVTEEEQTLARWILSDIEYLKDDIERLHGEIEEKKKTLAKYEAQLAGANATEDLYITKVPEVMKGMEAELVKVWDEWDISRQNSLKAELAVIGYSAFVDKHTWTTYDNLSKTKEQMHAQNVKDARALVLDLYGRVCEVTGEVTDWSDIHCTQGAQGFAVLNGRVNGKEGCARVESILAGGYNIQRLHIRVLVHAL